MSTSTRPRIRGLFVGNVAARLAALGALAAATVLVARVGGPELVGAFTLLRVLPGLAGVLAASVAVRARRIARPDELPRSALDVVPRPELLGAALVAVAISAMFYETLHFRHVWALFGLIAALSPAGRRTLATPRPAPAPHPAPTPQPATAPQPPPLESRRNSRTGLRPG